MRRRQGIFRLETNWACPHPNFTSFMASDNVCGHGAGTGPATPPTSARQNAAPGQSRRAIWDFANKLGTYENIGYGLSRAEGRVPVYQQRPSGRLQRD